MREISNTEKMGWHRNLHLVLSGKSNYLSTFCLLSRSCLCSTYSYPNLHILKITLMASSYLIEGWLVFGQCFDVGTAIPYSFPCWLFPEALWNIILTLRWENWGLERLNGLLRIKHFRDDRNKMPWSRSSVFPFHLALALLTWAI